jgi:hypothetical protein
VISEQVHPVLRRSPFRGVASVELGADPSQSHRRITGGEVGDDAQQQLQGRGALPGLVAGLLGQLGEPEPLREQAM